MKFGLVNFFTEDSLPPARMARELEDRGFESLFVPDHSHIPVAQESPRPGGRHPEDGDRLGDVEDTYNVPTEYATHFDPFVALTLASQATTKLRIGTCISLMTQRDPILTAKAISTLSVISEGRILFGVGAGWNKTELANHGTDFDTRFTLLRERVAAMRQIWENEIASYEGKLVKITPLWQGPKPRGKVPVLLGVHGPNAAREVVRWADEWIPAPRLLARPLPEEIAILRRETEKAGRERVPVSVVAPEFDELELCQELGVDRVIFSMPHGSPDDSLRHLDALQEAAEPFQ